MSRKKLSREELSSVHLGFPLERLRLDRSVDVIKGVHHPLDVGFVHLSEEILDPVLILNVMKHHKALAASGDEGGNIPEGKKTKSGHVIILIFPRGKSRNFSLYVIGVL